MATTTDADLTAADVAWDLDPLVDGKGEAGVDELLDEAERVAASVAERRGTVAQLDAAGLVSVMLELGTIAELVGRAASYASLRFAADTTDPNTDTASAKAALRQIQERLRDASLQHCGDGEGDQAAAEDDEQRRRRKQRDP